MHKIQVNSKIAVNTIMANNIKVPLHSRDRSSRSRECADVPGAAHSPAPVVSRPPLVSPEDISMKLYYIQSG